MESILRLIGAVVVSVLVAAASNALNWGFAWWVSALIGFAIVYGILVVIWVLDEV